jgi:hypothetical protein
MGGFEDHRMRRLFLIAMLSLLGTGCGDLISAPVRPEAEGLVLSLEASPRQTSPGDPVRLVARLRNTNSHAVTLNFASGCQILPYVLDATGRIVEPASGGWACTGALTSLSLDAGESVERAFAWTGTVRRYDTLTGRILEEPLPPGTYEAYATLERALLGVPGGRLVELRTARVPLTLH